MRRSALGAELRLHIGDTGAPDAEHLHEKVVREREIVDAGAVACREEPAHPAQLDRMQLVAGHARRHLIDRALREAAQISFSTGNSSAARESPCSRSATARPAIWVMHRPAVELGPRKTASPIIASEPTVRVSPTPLTTRFTMVRTAVAPASGRAECPDTARRRRVVPGA
jgi:hypothetical protein